MRATGTEVVHLTACPQRPDCHPQGYIQGGFRRMVATPIQTASPAHRTDALKCGGLVHRCGKLESHTPYRPLEPLRLAGGNLSRRELSRKRRWETSATLHTDARERLNAYTLPPRC